MGARTNIVLFGFMGTGKTCVGQAVAERLGMTYVDLDDLIEAREGTTISAIFATKREPYFRRIEAEVANEAAKFERHVIATGGGVVLHADNVRVLEATGVGICLNASAEVIYERVKEQTHRPLLAVNDPLARIRTLLAHRAPFYARVSHQIDTTGSPVEAVVDEVVAIWQRESQ
ncbi:MAG: shikimate kinase [Verrucomicrobia bacterium]|nr:shikimate kinase [Verrucomicrobiota bacterium]